MKAIRIHSFGGPDVLTIENVPIPAIRPDELLIEVHAASVNPVDYKIRSGAFRLSEIRPPLTLGRDVSGTVRQVGAAMINFQPGDEVYALLGMNTGGYAEYTVARMSEVAMKPRTLDHIHAAAVPLAALTAWQGLFDQGHLKHGQRVLIHGAGGGVGHFAVQFAKLKDATVYATAGRADLHLLGELGADEVIDHVEDRFEDFVDEIDLVLDLVGGETLKRSWTVLKDGGTIVSTLAQPSAVDAAGHHALAKTFMCRPNAVQLAEIGRLIDDHLVTVVVSKTLPLTAARQAHDELEHEHSHGKLVLTVG